MRGLLERVLDLEPKAINANDVDGAERQVRRHQHDRPPGWMNNGDEAHQLPDRAPQQIAHTIADFDAVLAVDGADKLLHRLDVGQQRFELDLLAIALRSAPRPGPVLRFGGRKGGSGSGPAFCRAACAGRDWTTPGLRECGW